MDQPTATIAIPTYNRSALLKISLDSVLSQTYSNFTVLVLDNASSDNTKDVVNSFSDPRIRYIRNDQNIGQMENWNLAIALNQSPFLCILQDDDLLRTGFLEASLESLENNPSAAFSYTLVDYIDGDGKRLRVQEEPDVSPGLLDGAQFLHLIAKGCPCTIAASSVLMRASSLRRAGVFDSAHCKHTYDRNLYYRLASYFDLYFIPQALAQVRLHASQASAFNWRSAESTGPVAAPAERIDAIAYLMHSPRAEDRHYRAWLADQLLLMNARQSEALHPFIPGLYWTYGERLQIAIRNMTHHIAPGQTLVLADEGQWALAFKDRKVIPFVEREGAYWGPPADDQAAISEIERLRALGAEFFVLGWPAFWWFDYYLEFRGYLETTFACLLKNSRLVIFDLRRRRDDSLGNP